MELSDGFNADPQTTETVAPASQCLVHGKVTAHPARGEISGLNIKRRLQDIMHAGMLAC